MSLKDRLFKRGRVEIGVLEVEVASAQRLIKELRDAGNEDAKYVLGLADEGRLPIAYIPDPVPEEGETWKAVAVVGSGAHFQEQSGFAYVLILNGQLVNEDRLRRNRKEVMRDIADGLRDVAGGIRGGYYQGRIPIEYPYTEAPKILEKHGLVGSKP